MNASSLVVKYFSIKGHGLGARFLLEVWQVERGAILCTDTVLYSSKVILTVLGLPYSYIGLKGKK